MPVRLVSPVNALIEGTLIRNSESFTVIISAEQPAVEVIRFYKDHFTNNGWTEPQQPHMGGFGMGSRIHQCTLCSGQDGPEMHITAADRKLGTDVWINVQIAPMYSRCRAPFGSMGSFNVLPQLYAPEKAKMRGMGQMMGSGDATSTASIVSEMKCGYLLKHFGNQLTESGWSEEGTLSNDEIGRSNWSFKDSSGNDWTALLVVVSWGRVNDWFVSLNASYDRRSSAVSR